MNDLGLLFCNLRLHNYSNFSLSATFVQEKKLHNGQRLITVTRGHNRNHISGHAEQNYEIWLLYYEGSRARQSLLDTSKLFPGKADILLNQTHE